MLDGIEIDYYIIIIVVVIAIIFIIVVIHFYRHFFEAFLQWHSTPVGGARGTVIAYQKRK